MGAGMLLRRFAAAPLIAPAALLAVLPLPKSLFYRDRRPTRLGRVVNRLWTRMAAAGLTPNSWPGEPKGGTIALETAGRRSGRRRLNVVTWVEYDGERYLVSMLGERVDWVRNVRAAQGEAAIRHGDRRAIRLDEVPVSQRGPIVQAYLKRTARATKGHLGLEPDAPLEAFDLIVPNHPVFRIVELDA